MSLRGVFLFALALAGGALGARAADAPLDPEFDRAGYLAASGKKEQAAVALEHYLARVPGDLDARDLLGQVRLALLQPDAAAAAYRTLLAADPASSHAVARLCDALVAAGRRREAIEVFRSYAARAPANAEVPRAIASLEAEIAAAARVQRRHGRLGIGLTLVAAAYAAAFAVAIRKL